MIFAETGRLCLRSLEKADLPRLTELIGDWDVARWMLRVPHPYTMKDAEEWLAHTSALDRAGKTEFFVLADKGDNALMGGVGVHPPTKPDPQPGEAELGYWLGKTYWGQGFMSEAVGAALPLGFARPETDLIAASTDPDNKASQNVLRKAGFRYLGIHPRTEKGLRGGATCTRWELAREAFEKREPAGS